jgi:cardiolipin synthase
LSSAAFCAEDVFYPAKVKDISDRNYEKAVINLLDNAQDSIVISMYILNPGLNDQHPVSRLMKDLEEALDRGVFVSIYLNTKADEDFTRGDEIAPVLFDRLRRKGGQILLVNPRYRLHDKMIIVDKRYVVIGSTNWSVTAFNDNYESSVLIDSPQLATDRLLRMQTIYLEGEDLSGPPQVSIKEEYPLSETLGMSCVLLERDEYFPCMVSNHDKRTMDLYILLIAEAARWKETSFYISMEKMGLDLGMPSDWTDTALRRQVIKCLRKLKEDYGLIDFSFEKARAAHIKMVNLEGKTFKVEKEFFSPTLLKRRKQNKQFVLLIEAYLKSRGQELSDFSYTQLSEMFSVARSTIREGVEDDAPDTDVPEDEEIKKEEPPKGPIPPGGGKPPRGGGRGSGMPGGGF